MFYIGQKVIIDCRDTDYMEDAALDNGMVGEVLSIKPDRQFPVMVRAESHIGPVIRSFRFDELKPVQNAAKII